MVIGISVTADYCGLIEFNGCTLIGTGSSDRRASTTALVSADIEVEFVELYIMLIKSNLKS